MTGRITEEPRPARAAVEEAVLHLVGAGGAPPRGRRHHADGAARARPAPGPAPRGQEQARSSSCRGPPSFNEADLSDKPSNMREAAPPLTDGADRAAPARLRGPDRLAARRRRPRQEARRDRCKKTGQLDEHADRVPLRQRLAAGPAPHPGRQVPPLRGVAARAADLSRARACAQGRTVRGQVVEHRLRPDAGRRRERARRPHDGRLCRCCPSLRNPRERPNRGHRDRGAAPALRGRHPRQRLGPALQGRAHRPLHLRRLHGDRRARSSTTAATTRTSCATSPPIRATRASRPPDRRDEPARLAARGPQCATP